jgi:sigma-E factor negative regulatory protein RseC
MIEQEAVVTRCDNSQIWIKAVKPPCQACRVPCTNPDNSETPPAGPTFSIVTGERFSPGERVSLEVPAGMLIEASFLIYLLPLVGFMAGAVIGDKLGMLLSPAWHETLSILGGFLSLFLVYAILRFHHAGRDATFANLSIRRLR